MKYHPDKNKADNATEIFKKISLAYACLSDDQKRKNYDMTGSEEGMNMPNFDPNDLFRAFFQSNGGDPFAQMFNNGGFTVYTNMNGGQSHRGGQGMGGMGAGPNIFDLLNGMGQPQQRRRRTNQQHQHHQQREAYEEDENFGEDVFDVFRQARARRGNTNRNQQHREAKTPAEAILINILNQ